MHLLIRRFGRGRIPEGLHVGDRRQPLDQLHQLGLTQQQHPFALQLQPLGVAEEMQGVPEPLFADQQHLIAAQIGGAKLLFEPGKPWHPGAMFVQLKSSSDLAVEQQGLAEGIEVSLGIAAGNAISPDRSLLSPFIQQLLRPAGPGVALQRIY